MSKFRLRSIIAGLAAITVTALLPLTTTSAAQAQPAQPTPIPCDSASQCLPAPQETCSSGQTKLDYEWQSSVTGDYVWSNVCGTGTWNWDDPSYDTLLEIRMPTSPYHRVWLHQYANNTGDNYCLYSEDNDVTVPYQSAWDIYLPGNVQVSANTASC